METMEEVKKEFKLPNEKVIVRLVNKARGAVKDSNHIMFNMIPGATVNFCPRNQKGSSVIECPLNEEEIAFFEDRSKSGMAFKPGELSPYAKDNENYWRSKQAQVVLSDRPLHLDLSKAVDYLKYKTLLSQRDHIAPCAADEFKKKTYIFVITSEEEKQKQTVKSGDKKKRAWKIAGKMEDNADKMINYLTIVGKRPSANAKVAFLITEINKQVEENIDEFLSTMEDEQFDTRVLLTKSLQNKSVVRDGTKYFLAGGDPLSKKGDINNLANTLNYLDANENQDIRLTLTAKIEK